MLEHCMKSKVKDTEFKKAEKRRQVHLIESDTQGHIFYHAENGGMASRKDPSGLLHESSKEWILKDSSKNLLSSIYDDAINYFKIHDIAWWHMEAETSAAPTGNVMSSQIHCLNHLFGIRNNEEAIKAILLNATGIEFDSILPALDNDGLIAFEFTYNNKELLGEGDKGAQRGAFCTSIDAMIRAQKDEEIYLIPIEWKYTEAYEDQDKTCSKRLQRYQHLIEKSEQLKVPTDGVPHSIYMKEPQYELMRQTLLVEQIIRLGLADHFIHIFVVPGKNEELRKSVDDNYKPMLNNPDLFCCIDPYDLLKPLTIASFINDKQISNMIDYLRTRYWDD